MCVSGKAEIDFFLNCHCEERCDVATEGSSLTSYIPGEYQHVSGIRLDCRVSCSCRILAMTIERKLKG